jgi:hypothetical protein
MDEVLALLKANWQMIAVAAGPLTVSMVLRLVLGKSRLLFMLVNASGAWLAIRVVLAPYMDLTRESVNSLVQITNR